MNELMMLAAASTIIWFLIDRAKPFWSEYSFGKYITLGVSLILSAATVFTYNLDLIFSLGVSSEISIIGKILTILAMMSGASGISEIISLVKNKQN